jgi:hypothetical protein
MAVLAEAISVIVRIDSLNMKYPGGSTAYARACPNSTYCQDSSLTRVGFMTPGDVGRFIAGLLPHGLEFVSNGEYQEIAVVDQHRGLMAPCRWLSFGKHQDGYSFVWLAGGPEGELLAPSGWSPENSRSLQFVANEDVSDRFLSLGPALGGEQFLDLATGKQMWAGRTSEGSPLAPSEEELETKLGIVRRSDETPSAALRPSKSETGEKEKGSSGATGDFREGRDAAPKLVLAKSGLVGPFVAAFVLLAVVRRASGESERSGLPVLLGVGLASASLALLKAPRKGPRERDLDWTSIGCLALGGATFATVSIANFAGGYRRGAWFAAMAIYVVGLNSVIRNLLTPGMWAPPARPVFSSVAAASLYFLGLAVFYWSLSMR